MHLRNTLIHLCFVLLLPISLSSQSQCIKTDAEALEVLSYTDPQDPIAGKWNVNIRGTLFHKTNIIQSDYDEYPMYWYILPYANGYNICATPGFESELINGLLIKDETIDGQFFSYIIVGGETNISLGRLVNKDILTFQFQASDTYIKNTFTGKVKEDMMEDLILVWEYVLTKAELTEK